MWDRSLVYAIDRFINPGYADKVHAAWTAPVTRGRGWAMAEPLAQRLRPRTLAEVCGQQHLLAPGKVFRRTLESGRVPNMIFYGPSAAANHRGPDHRRKQRYAPA